MDDFDAIVLVCARVVGRVLVRCLSCVINLAYISAHFVQPLAPAPNKSIN